MAYDRSSSFDRREFLTRIGAAGAVVTLALNESGCLRAGSQASSGIALPALP